MRDVTAAMDPHTDASATRRTISHELRNPLTAILGHIDLLIERDDISAAARRQLDVVERAGTRMERLIDDALVTPGARAEDSDVHFDLADIARASIEGFAPVADAGGIALDVDLEQYLPLCADAFRLRQVVDNVISNAIKYVQRGGKVSVRGHCPAPGEVALTVTDTGIGIGVDDLPRIFEPDFRTEVAREQGIPGTGLGLGISRDIVLAQGGRIDVKSDLGQGTEVSIVLPSSREPRESSPERSPA
ncbi:sensor histidine kinase KdpD [Microbacterium sp. KRD172]|uniref:sensor histidine kinase n=1 Tax=Microbacterium sp. KRD172 TaxID=2729727 RepID=UPI0019D07D39|nr:HAMP domain-containing sensor histidine kinase [Microbacterium sp. KRD172]